MFWGPPPSLPSLGSVALSLPHQLDIEMLVSFLFYFFLFFAVSALFTFFSFLVLSSVPGMSYRIVRLLVHHLDIPYDWSYQQGTLSPRIFLVVSRCKWYGVIYTTARYSNRSLCVRVLRCTYYSVFFHRDAIVACFVTTGKISGKWAIKNVRSFTSSYQHHQYHSGAELLINMWINNNNNNNNNNVRIFRDSMSGCGHTSQ